MMNFIRSLCMTIGAALLKVIPTLYSLFHGLAAEPTIFNTSEIRRLTTNVYTLVSVVMLFALATRAIAAIVNPDNLWDSKKGVTGVIKRSVIALILIVAIPFGFHYFYEFQTQIINNNLIEKIILGITYENADLTQEELDELEEKLNDDSLSESEKNALRKKYQRGRAAYKIGTNLAQNILAASVHPTKTDSSGEKCVASGYGVSVSNPILHPIRTWKSSTNSKDASLGAGVVNVNNASNVCTNYNNAIGGDSIDYVDYLVPQVNAVVGFDASEVTSFTSLGAVSQFTNAASSVNAANGGATLAADAINSNTYYVLDLDYWGLLLLVASGAVAYMLIIFCIDSAVRLIKMAFLEITAPVSIMAYIFGGSDVLKKWFKELTSTAISFFLRVAAISFIALVLANLESFTKNLPSYYGNLTKIFIIIGTLIFAKKIPEVIEKTLGIKIANQGGIGGRLGQMAGVGKVAQNAWKTLGKTAKATATLPVLGLGAAAAIGAKVGDKKIFDGQGSELVQKLKESRALAGAQSVGQLYKSGGGLKGAQAAFSSYNKNPNVANANYQKQLDEQKIRADRVKDAISTAGSNMTVVDPNNPNVVHKLYNNGVIDEEAVKLMTANGTYENNANKLIDALKLTDKEKEVVKKAHDSKIANLKAQDNLQRVNDAIKYLNNLSSKTVDKNAKQKIATLVADLEQGADIDVSKLDTRLDEIRALATTSTFNLATASSVKANISTLNDDGIDAAIAELTKQKASMDIANRTKIESVINDLSAAKASGNYSTLNLADIESKIDDVRINEGKLNSTMSESTHDKYVKSLETVMKENHNTLQGLSVAELSYRADDKKEKADKDAEDVNKIMEKASQQSKDNIKGITKQFNELDKISIRNRE